MNALFAPNIVRAEASYTRADRARFAEDRGMAPRRVRGGYIDDLVALGKSVMLCTSMCERKFDATANGYATSRRIPLAMGKCDGCGQFHNLNRLFLPASQAIL